MGICYAKPKPRRREKKPNPFAADYRVRALLPNNFSVLQNPTGSNIEEFYKLGGELGRGEFGITYFCTEKSSGENFACKMISKRKLKRRVDVEDVQREVAIMKHLPKHPNIVSLKDTFEDDRFVHIVMELCQGGELFERIAAKGHFSEKAAASVIHTIVEVIQTCHAHGVIHRDLKPENFLFASKKETSLLKAIDFGLSVFFKPGDKFNEIVGSPYYMAPELLRRNYGPEVDVWSAGVILYILLSGVPPFWAASEQGIAQAIIRSVVKFERDPWPVVSDKAKDLVAKMLNPDPKLRLTAEQVLDHPWLHNDKISSAPLGETVRARLMQFATMNKLKKKALRVLADHLSKEEVAGLKEKFQMMDTTNRGKITSLELKDGIQKLGHKITESDIQLLMESGDVDRDGYLNYEEFVALSMHLRKTDDNGDEHLRKAFEFFDKNGSGYIEIEELREALTANENIPASEDVIVAILNDVDTDKDGRISFEEFAAMMKAGTDWRMVSRQYSRERYTNLSLKLMKEGSLQKNITEDSSIADVANILSEAITK